MRCNPVSVDSTAILHVAFIGTHLPADLVDHGLSQNAGAWCLALVGFFNIIGAYSAGAGGEQQQPTTTDRSNSLSTPADSPSGRWDTD